jgi:phosphonate ABC transporter permease subunit PhnE
MSGERIDPGSLQPLACLDNILNNADWQHGDVWIKLLQTIVMAFVGTLFAGVVAFPLSFWRRATSRRAGFLNQINKRFFDFLRSVDMLIWALFFTRAFGPGPLAGISAIFFTDTGTLGKLYSEALENIDDKQREGVRSVGASPASVQRFGVVPQVLPVFVSQALYFWESNTRSATIIGAVGAGGIGLKLWEAMRTNAGLGKCRLYGDPDPRRRLPVRRHLQCPALPPDGRPEALGYLVRTRRMARVRLFTRSAASCPTGCRAIIRLRDAFVPRRTDRPDAIRSLLLPVRRPSAGRRS